MAARRKRPAPAKPYDDEGRPIPGMGAEELGFQEGEGPLPGEGALGGDAMYNEAYPASPTAAATDSQPFSEEETRALIRIRQEMDAAFLSNSRKRGLFTLYHAVADRLYGMGGGAWPKRPHHTVAQRWNNIVGSYKEMIGLRATGNGSKPKSFRYEADMAWFRDQLKPAHSRKAKRAVEAEQAESTLERQLWHAFFHHLDHIRRSGVPPEVQDLCLRACGSLLHPHRRAVLLPIWTSAEMPADHVILEQVEYALATYRPPEPAPEYEL